MEYCTIFLFYGFCGFLLEVAFTRVTGQRKRDRKCLYFLPLCPVYGLGALCILALPVPVRARPLLLLFCGGLVATVAEYCVAFFSERVLHVAFWDYGHLPANLGGRVCLLFSGLWGLLALGLVYIAHPAVSPLLAAVPAPVTVAWTVTALADGLYSTCLLRRARHTDCLRWPLAVRLRPAPAP